MRILGIDYGTKRVGLAVSDESLTLAREFGIISPEEFWDQIEILVKENEIVKVIIGLPLNMSGEATDSTRRVQEFCDKLSETIDLPIEYMDERLSSVMAGNLPGGKKNIDSLAAQIILQNYLDKQKQ
jgi:putative holliday junction resolvase